MATILEKTAGLAAYVRAVDCKSFGGAAKLLGTSPSAVSKSIARLEQRLGVRLLNRAGRTLVMTVEGTAYYERVKPLVQAIEDAADVVQRADMAHGALRVSVPVELGRTLVAAWARDFAGQHPHIKLVLSVTDRPTDLVREGFDAAVRVGELADSGLMGRRLGEVETVIVGSPDYLRRHGTPKTPADLRRHAVLRHLRGGRPAPLYFADGTSLPVDGPLDTDDPGALRQAALAGVGLACLLRAGVEDDLGVRRLERVLADAPTPRLPLNVLHPYDRQVPVRVKLFMDFMAERLGGG
jgi:DNA-binding transcriptional LysR family regulator